MVRDFKGGQRNGIASLQEIERTALAGEEVTDEKGRQPVSAKVMENREWVSPSLSVQEHERNQWVRGFMAKPKVALQMLWDLWNSLFREVEGDKGLNEFKESSEKLVKC